MMILDELLLDLGPASSDDAGPLVSDGTRKKKKRPPKTESVGSETRIHTGVQAAVVAIHQAVPELRCAVYSYEGHTELELGIHYVHQHRHGDAGPRKGQRRFAVPRSAAVARDIVDLTAGSSDVDEAEEELYVDVPETDNHAVCGELSPYDTDDSCSSARADYVTRDDGPTPEARQSAADVSEPGPDYDEPARGAGQRDNAVPDSGAGAIRLISTACQIVPRTAGPGGDAADDDRGEAARRAASVNPPLTGDVGGSTPIGGVVEPLPIAVGGSINECRRDSAGQPVRCVGDVSPEHSGRRGSSGCVFLSVFSPFLRTWSIRPWATMDCVSSYLLYGTVGTIYLKKGTGGVTNGGGAASMLPIPAWT